MTTQHGETPPPAQADWSYFLDVDGTLIEIADRPEAVHVPQALISLLGTLHETVGGACALVSGRSIAELDRLFAPLRLPTSGLHGVEWRDATGQMHHATTNGASSEDYDLLHHALDAARDALAQFMADHPTLRLEDKGKALALHYRAAPVLAQDVIAATNAIVANHPGLVAQQGKMVVELKPAGIDKGLAVMRYVAQAPFNGRRPVFVGDDLTDEYGFRAVNELGGVSVCIGDRAPSSAQWRLHSVDEARRWLGNLVQNTALGNVDGVA